VDNSLPKKIRYIVVYNDNIRAFELKRINQLYRGNYKIFEELSLAVEYRDEKNKKKNG
jgi:hypothetical protein